MQRGRIGDNAERNGRGYANQEGQRGKSGDNTKRKGGGSANRKGTEEGGLAVIHRRKTEAIESKSAQSGRIADSIERKGRWV